MLKSFLFQLSLYTLGYLCASGKMALAQDITTDGTTNTTVNQEGNNFTIEQGDRAGDNLFHSFGNFSVPTNGSAFFNNAADISNIFNRVTGGNISNIDGLIGANGTANLFLINPAGILFGENASLSIGGSFFGTTADSILFEDGEFSATNLDNSPLLTINAPIGLNLRDNPRAIVNRSTADDVGLQIATGEDISLIGGDVNLEGGLIAAPGGRIQLGGLSAAGTVSIADNGSLSFPSDVVKGNVFLSNNAAASITSDGGGLISVNAERLELTDNSLIEASIGEGLGSENAVAGTIEIFADSLEVNSNSAIVASTFGQGDAGTININVPNIFITRDFSGIYSNVGLPYIATEDPVADAAGNGGVININTNNLSLTGGARIASNSAAMGDAGDININATGKVLFSGGGTIPVEAFGNNSVISGASSQVQFDGAGSSGQVNIQADSLTLTETGAVLVDNSGQEGNAGDISLNIGNEIFLDGALILSQIQEGATGNGGDINITANSLEALGGSQISADTKSEGDAGNINIEVNETVSFQGDGTRVQTFVNEGATGDGGNISLKAGELNLTDRSVINADTAGEGDAGNVEVVVARDIKLDSGSIIQSQTRGNATGNAGNIVINAEGSLISTNGNFILADSQAEGNGGNITITVGEQILLEGFSFFNDDPNIPLPSQIVAGLASENSDGTGGNIEITADSLVLNEAAFISSNTVMDSIGRAGSVTINVDSLQITENSLINVFTGNEDPGGAITVNARTLNLTNGGKILAATTGEGDAGNINLNVSEQILIDGVESSTRYISDQERLQFLNDLQDEPSGIYANATNGSTGEGGNVNIGMMLEQTPENFVIRNDGRIIASSDGEGSGGNISLKSQSLELDNGAVIIASTRFGEGGIINLEIDTGLTLDRNSLISARAFEEASGGNLTINTNFIAAFSDNGDGNGNDIIANAESGRGGNITIDAESLIGIAEGEAIPGNNSNDIDARSEVDGLDGTVNIKTLDIDPVEGATELPQNVVEPEQITAQTCNAGREAIAQSSLIIQGRGSAIDEPGSPLTSNNIYVDGETDSTSSIPAPIETAQGKIQPARGIKVAEDGTIILTAYRTDNAGDRLPEAKQNCS